jgi:fructoselysine-6-P-deglycase FrlB-like protein
MDPANFDWVPLEDQPGSASKHLGEFSELRTKIALCRIAPGASLRLTGHSIYFVAAGSGAVAARAFEPHATIHLNEGEQAIATASEPVELLQIGLPRFHSNSVPGNAWRAWARS